MSKPDKIDTQGMAAPGIKNSKMLKTTHYLNGYPSFTPLTTPKMIDGMLRDELKELINEVMDEREGKMDYISYFDTEHFKYRVGGEEPPYRP